MVSDHPIKFYNESSSSPYYLKQVQEFINRFDFSKTDYTLDNIIEIHNVLEHLNLSDSDENNSNLDFQLTARKSIGRYTSNQKLTSLNEEYQNLCPLYKEGFWEVFVNYNLIKNTTASQFQEFVEDNQIYLGNLLTKKVICKRYNTVLKSCLLKKPKYFELFLRKYDSAHVEKFEFPKGFSDTDINNWARRYCEIPDANANYLNQLSHWSLQHDYKIEDKIIIKARRAHKEIMSGFFKEEQGFSWGVEVSIKPNVDKIIDFQLSDNYHYHIYFDKNWLDNEREYPTLLNNFIYVFHFFNKFTNFSLIGSQYESNSLFEMLKTESKYSYKTSLEFDINRSSYSLIFLAYYDYLAFNDIDMEELLGYCYNYYFEDVFNIDQFRFTSSSKENNYYSRAKLLIPELDGILKEFDIYREEGEIDPELFELQSKPKNYRIIKSFSEKKYVYFKSEKIINLCHLLFSNKSLLLFAKKESKMTSFYDLVLNGIKISDFNETQKKIIKENLKESNIIDYSLSNQIEFKDVQLILIYKYLWNYSYLSLLSLPKKDLLVIYEEVEKGNLRYGDTLFSEQESDYISYIMDNKKFNNGLEIRNKITHGNFSRKSLKDHKGYYLELMMILMLFTVKINEELNYIDLKNDDE